jgi:prepilin peptidase CpaA
MTAYEFLVALLLAAAVFDVCGRRIPNWLTGPAVLAGLTFNAWGDGTHGLLMSAAGLFLGLALLAPFYMAGGMGAGDVKLMGAIGALLGPKAVFLAFLFSAIVGGLYAVLLLLARGYLGETISRYGAMLRVFRCSGDFVYLRPSEKEGKLLLRYGVSIAVGTLLSVWKGSCVL